MLRVDHVIMAVADLDRAAGRLVEDTGLGSAPGGVHPAFGTANRIVPVGAGSYVELMAVHDAGVAATSPVGRWVGAAGDNGDVPAGWMVATDDLAAIAARLGVAVVPGQRHLPDGTTIGWRLAGIEAMVTEPPLPAFIAWDVPAGGHPSAMAVEHQVLPAGVAWIEVGGDTRRLAHRLGRWLGTDGAGDGGAELRVVPDAAPGLRAVGIALSDGTETVLA